ncbi:hypothetical protein KAFR_0C05850 [Kazachstania africana CBS 2517]|uniref:Uncharacterized protein n=1 Tax=Kazachstania africana (strain ATCC 22294 / BCRC 22015 / CBS 2517 / CECT 1963 / NBRC 1671 / NRRL Y-8276) TaxID=1071382 RepID=H2AT76_KAZAF|nr:hypothetical protein KAFR_0C05850 [Kazachstania africana CBS 2517]CCF57576.1 hypothetical protein KAFR_0C05850 [Kazachstania africana CBS 2517]
MYKIRTIPVIIILAFLLCLNATSIAVEYDSPLPVANFDQTVKQIEDSLLNRTLTEKDQERVQLLSVGFKKVYRKYNTSPVLLYGISRLLKQKIEFMKNEKNVSIHHQIESLHRALQFALNHHPNDNVKVTVQHLERMEKSKVKKMYDKIFNNGSKQQNDSVNAIQNNKGIIGPEILRFAKGGATSMILLAGVADLCALAPAFFCVLSAVASTIAIVRWLDHFNLHLYDDTINYP